MNAAIPIDRLVDLLGENGALNDFTLFAGRGYDFELLKGSRCAWLFGPARNGKSSLARKLACHARSSGRRASVVDASDLDPRDFDGLLRRVCAMAGRSAAAGTSSRAAFEDLVNEAGAPPLLVVLDEFDRFAVELGTDQQAFLRRLHETSAQVWYLFVSRNDPRRIVEDVVDERSRLLGICSPIHSLPVLEVADVEGLCAIVARSFGVLEGPRWAKTITAEIGGHTIAVREVLKRAVALVRSDLATPADCVETVIAMEEPNLIRLLGRHWRDLGVRCRAVLLSEGPGTPDEQRAAGEQGYWSRRRKEMLRPRLLLRAGRELGMSALSEGGERMAVVRDVHELIAIVNRYHQRRHKRAVFDSRVEEAFQYPLLLRRFTDEQDLHICVDHLARLLYEGGRDRAAGASETITQWRIDDEAACVGFRQSAGMRALVGLRMYFDHSERGEKKAASREEDVGELFKRACGTSTPKTAGAFERVLDHLLGLLCNALRSLACALTDPEPDPAGGEGGSSVGRL